MQDLENLSWIDQLEVTGPIKSIMNFVDELSRNYDRRVEAMHNDYQQDIDEILACYRQEKQDFQTIIDQQKITIAELENQLKILQQSYKQVSVEYKLTQDNLEHTKEELHELSKVLKTEQELVALTQERIRVANEQLKIDLIAKSKAETTPHVDPEMAEYEILEKHVDKPKRGRFAKAQEFFQQVFADRRRRPVIISSPEPAPEYEEDKYDQDTFSY